MMRGAVLPDAAAFEAAIRRHWREAETAGAECLKICSGDLHRQLGGYPGPNHRMPDCCQVMRRLMVGADSIVEAPPKRNGVTLVIGYSLPR
jgi:5-methylcytosine-specific restriction protein A